MNLCIILNNPFARFEPVDSHKLYSYKKSVFEYLFEY